MLRPRPWRWSRDAQLATLLFGFAMAGMNIVFYLALRTVPLGVCVTVEFLGPLTVALVQTRRWRDLLWVALAGAGVALLGLRGGGDVPLGGLLLALIAGAFWGLYILASARVGRAVPGTEGLAVALVIAAAHRPAVRGARSRAGARPAPGPAHRRGGRPALVDRPLRLRAGRTAPDADPGLRRADEPRAGRRRDRRADRARPGADGREMLALVLVSVASVGITLGRRGDQAAPQPLE